MRTSQGLATIAEALRRARAAAQHHSDTPSLDAQVLLAHITAKPRSWILAHPEAQLSPQEQKEATAACQQLTEGFPLPYILGHWAFYHLDFELTPDVLIPRPETELLVATALHWLQDHPQSRKAADIGTGSGCIAVSLAVNLPGLVVTATDLSAAALAVARRNAAKHHVNAQIHFRQADTLDIQPVGYDLICTNPPYISTSSLRQLAVYGREPSLALDGGPDGLDQIRKLVGQVPRHLRPGGLLLIEIEANQGKIAIELTQEHFPESEINLLTDLSGRDRLLHIQT